MERQIIEAEIDKAIQKLKEKDEFLIKEKLSEWALSHRLAIYLEGVFPGYNVDCEYNKKIDIQNNTSVQKSIPTSVGGRSQRKIRPDIIIHKRGGPITAVTNLLIIQLKKASNPIGRREDTESLNELTKQAGGGYKYAYGLFLVINNKTGDITKIWFKDGEKIS